MNATDIRKSARQSLSGKWGKSVVIVLAFLLLEYAISFLTGLLSKVSILSIVGSIISVLVSIPISFGLISSFIKLKRNEDVGYFDFLIDGFKNFKKVWLTFLQMILKMAIPIVILIVGYILIGYSIYSINVSLISSFVYSPSSIEDSHLEGLKLDLAKAKADYLDNSTKANSNKVKIAQKRLDNFQSEYDTAYNTTKASSLSNKNTTSTTPGIICGIAGIILLIGGGIYLYIKSLYFALSYYVLFDNPNMSTKDIVLKSKSLMTGNKGNLFVLYISFIGWAILGVITLGIGLLWLIPYIYISTICFYEKLKNKSNGISNNDID